MNGLRTERLKRVISQTKLCMLTGIAQSDLSAIENGRKVAHAGWRLRIARALKVDAETLFGSEEGKPKQQSTVKRKPHVSPPARGAKTKGGTKCLIVRRLKIVKFVRLSSRMASSCDAKAVNSLVCARFTPINTRRSRSTSRRIFSIARVRRRRRRDPVYRKIEGVDFKTAVKCLGLETYRPSPERLQLKSEAQRITLWARGTSIKLCDALREIGDKIRICKLARKQSETAALEIVQHEARLIRQWAILTDLDDDLNDPKIVLELWNQREEINAFVERL
jgi:transcriptional regulator with XRE-family HTH domain